VDSLDLQIDIGVAGADAYEVTARAPDGTEASAPLRLPVSATRFDAMLNHVRLAVLASSTTPRGRPTEAERPAQELGALLFDALPDRVRALLVSTKLRADAEERRLRLVLRVRPPELARLPWEFLFDAHDEDWLCLDTALIRYPTVLKPRRALMVAPPLRILGMTARPGDHDALDVEGERMLLHDAVGALQEQGLVELTWVAGPTWRDLQEAVRRGPWHVFHFIGHGGFDAAADEGTLQLVGDGGRVYPLHGSSLAMLLRGHPSLRLVVLNACRTGQGSAADPYSSVAAALMRRGIPAVLAMQFQITDRAAIECSRTFYRAIADRLPVDMAVTEARQAMRLAVPHTLEWATPVLYLRSPDGAVFTLLDAAPPVVEPPVVEAPLVEAPVVEAPVVEPPVVEPPAAEPPAAEPPVVEVSAPPEPVERAPAEPARDEPARVEPARAGRIEPHAGSVPRRLATYRRPGPVHAVALNPDGSVVAIARDDSKVDLIEVDTDEVRAPVGPQYSYVSNRIYAVAFSPDGRYLAVGGTDQYATVWDTSDGSHVQSPHAASTVRSVTFSPDGQLLGAACSDNSLRVWRWRQRAERTFHHVGRASAVLAVAFNPAGDRVASGGGDRTVRVWSVLTGGQIRELGHGATVRAVAFSRDGRLLATASDDGTRVFDAYKPLDLVPIERTGRTAVAFGRDGRTLVVAGRTGMSILDSVTGDVRWALTSVPVNCLGISASGTRVAVGTERGTVEVWSLGEDE
jgi:hypothetical protein